MVKLTAYVYDRGAQAPVSGVAVTVRKGGTDLRGTTNQYGVAVFEPIAPGMYTVTALIPSFGDNNVRTVTASANSVVGVSFVLQQR